MKAVPGQTFFNHHRRPLKPLGKVRADLAALSPVHEGSRGPLSSLIDDLSRLCIRIEDRLEAGPDAPLTVAVLGATGTGKSKVFNTLVGDFVSPSGYRRPTTMAPVVCIHPVRLDILNRPSFFPEYERRIVTDRKVEFHADHLRELVLAPIEADRWKDLVLIDTPDFDSVLAPNRTAARDVFDRSEAVVFVTDAIKYADQAAWDYLGDLKDREKPAILVVNRLKNPKSLEDFQSRLDRFELERPVVSMGDVPALGDTDPFPDQAPFIEEIKARLAEWAGSGRQHLLAESIFRDWLSLHQGLRERLLPELNKASTSLNSLRFALADAGSRAEENLTQRLTVAISGELKQSLVTQIQTLFLKWDLLKYPRRIIGLPFMFVRDKVLAPLGVSIPGGGGAGSLQHEIDRLFEANQETLVAVVHEINRAATDRFHADQVGGSLAAQPAFETLPFNADQVRKQYRDVREDLELWVREQARELVKGLNVSEKMTFYLAQAVSIGLFISIQVHTGGGFSFFDGLVDGALAPILSKLTGHALSREKVKAFEIQAQNIHLAGCRNIAAGQVQRYMDYLNEPEAGLAAAGGLAQATSDLERAFESLI